MPKIYRRLESRWSPVVKNKGKHHCDRCGDRLWANPSGGLYCNGNWVGCGAKSEAAIRKILQDSGDSDFYEKHYATNCALPAYCEGVDFWNLTKSQKDEVLKIIINQL